MVHDRESKNAQSRARLAEVVALGIERGAFTNSSRPIPADSMEPDPWRFVEVTTPAGLVFSLVAGGWNKEGAISASVGGIDREGIRVHLSDTAMRGKGPEASASYTRPAEAILKDILRRVIQHPEGIAAAECVRSAWEERKAQRGGLRAHVEALKALGYTFNQLSESEVYSAKGYGGSDRNPYSLTVYANGSVSFEATCTADRFAEVFALLNRKGGA